MIGRACIVLGAGRKAVDENIDPAVGISGIVKTGNRVNKGDPLLLIHSNSTKKTDEAKSLLDKAFSISTETPEPTVLITSTIKPNEDK